MTITTQQIDQFPLLAEHFIRVLESGDDAYLVRAQAVLSKATNHADEIVLNACDGRASQAHSAIIAFFGQAASNAQRLELQLALEIEEVKAYFEMQILD